MLAQSYDWLIFLIDEGITEFIEEVIFDPPPEYSSIRNAFLASYAPDKKKNQFTKVKMNMQADEQLLQYFASNASRTEKWFSMISPSTGSLEQMRREIHTLQTKDWRGILR